MEVEGDIEDDEDMIFIKAREFLKLVRRTTSQSNVQLHDVTVEDKSLEFKKPSNEVNKLVDDVSRDNQLNKKNEKTQYGGSVQFCQWVW